MTDEHVHLPEAATAMLRMFADQVRQIEESRTAYLRGVFDVLGVDYVKNDVQISTDSTTYTSKERGFSE